MHNTDKQTQAIPLEKQEDKIAFKIFMFPRKDKHLHLSLNKMQ